MTESRRKPVKLASTLNVNHKLRNPHGWAVEAALLALEPGIALSLLPDLHFDFYISLVFTVCVCMLAPGYLEGRIVTDVCPARFVSWVLLLPTGTSRSSDCRKLDSAWKVMAPGSPQMEIKSN